jgi:hypothetical protein
LVQALIANGTRSRLVVMPGEGHPPVTSDGIAATLADKAAWLHSYCPVVLVPGDRRSSTEPLSAVNPTNSGLD